MRIRKCNHIFFHSLILYPELAFSKDNDMAAGYEDWMITKDEFVQILKELYQRNYRLVRQKDYIDGKIHLPKHLHPLILSFDDVNYYNYMKGSGFANKIIVQEDGEIATDVITPDGERKVTRYGDHISILEAFLKTHPDFSYDGARGILAVTGYEGVLGYHFYNPEDSLAIEAKVVADKLKELGWEFACHSYTHNSIWFKVKELPLEKIIYDTDKWKRMIEPVVGKTEIYISPFGILLDETHPALRYIVNAGFHQYCYVDNQNLIEYHSEFTLIPRQNIDGVSMRTQKLELTKKYFHVRNIVDSKRIHTYDKISKLRLQDFYYFARSKFRIIKQIFKKRSSHENGHC